MGKWLPQARNAIQLSTVSVIERLPNDRVNIDLSCIVMGEVFKVLIQLDVLGPEHSHPLAKFLGRIGHTSQKKVIDHIVRLDRQKLKSIVTKEFLQSLVGETRTQVCKHLVPIL